MTDNPLQQILALTTPITMEQTQVPSTTDTFSEGVYLRTIHMLANTFIVGRRHKTRHMNIITKGSAWVDCGDGPVLYTAPVMFESQAGVQKRLFIVEDMDWTTVHVTEETDLDIITQNSVYTEEESLAYFKEQQCLGE